MSFDLTKDELRKVALEVEGHVLGLHGNWRAYRKLFLGNADSQPVLAEVASELFWLLERDVKAAVFMAFRQITDAPKSSGKANASFAGLLRAAAGPDYTTKHVDLVGLIEGITATPIIRDHVNRYMAHFSLDLFAGKTLPPDSVEIDQVEGALAATRQFMNGFMKRFLGEDAFEYEKKASVIPKQVERLASVLALGLKA